jgi:hypothetical protein
MASPITSANDFKQFEYLDSTRWTLMACEKFEGRIAIEPQICIAARINQD